MQVGDEVAQHPKVVGRLGQLSEHPLHARGGDVAGEFQEEHILPAPSLDGTGLQAHHVQAVDGEDSQDLVQGTALVGHAEAGADLISVRPQLQAGGDDHEAGGVVAVVVDSDVAAVDAVVALYLNLTSFHRS